MPELVPELLPLELPLEPLLELFPELLPPELLLPLLELPLEPLLELFPELLPPELLLELLPEPLLELLPELLPLELLLELLAPPLEPFPELLPELPPEPLPEPPLEATPELEPEVLAAPELELLAELVPELEPDELVPASTGPPEEEPELVLDAVDPELAPEVPASSPAPLDESPHPGDDAAATANASDARRVRRRRVSCERWRSRMWESPLSRPPTVQKLPGCETAHPHSEVRARRMATTQMRARQTAWTALADRAPDENRPRPDRAHVERRRPRQANVSALQDYEDTPIQSQKETRKKPSNPAPPNMYGQAFERRKHARRLGAACGRVPRVLEVCYEDGSKVGHLGMRLPRGRAAERVRRLVVGRTRYKRWIVEQRRQRIQRQRRVDVGWDIEQQQLFERGQFIEQRQRFE